MEEELRRLLHKTAVVGCELRYFDEIGSTNTYAKELARAGAPDGTVVIAGHQTAGRGRMTRSFHSPSGQGIYLTALLRPNLPAERLPPVTALAGVAACDAVEEVCGVRPGVKWPNDLVLGGRKLCGILTELVITEEGLCLLIGVGLNVLQAAGEFPPDIAETATSLLIELGRPVSSPALTAALIKELDRMYAALRSGDLTAYLTAYRQDCVNLGKSVQLLRPDGFREAAFAVDIDGDFGLVVRGQEGEEQTLRSGEVSVRGLYGYLE